MRLLAAALCATLVLGASAACTKGKNGCKKCDATNTKCLECETYWYNDDTGAGSPAYGLTSAGTCVRCQPRGSEDQRRLVSACDGDRPTVATLCNDYEFSDAVYLRTDGICDRCTAGPAGKDCTACKDGSGECTKCGSYHLNPRTKKCVGCKSEGCIDCRKDPAVCADCSGGWYKAGATCVSCESAGLTNCNNCERKMGRVACTWCATYDKQGWGVKNGRCARCQQPGCWSCSEDASKCSSCKWGWRRNEAAGTCTRCPAGCGSCDTSPRKCDQCLNSKWKLVKGACVRKA